MSATPDQTASMIGKVVLGRYRILRHLADGGMGAIYLARSEGAGGFVRPVVIKSVLPSHIGDTRMVDLFIREARIMSNLRHPGIVSVIDFAQEGHTHFMVLDYVHGFHVGRWHKYIQRVKKDRFPSGLAIHIVLHVLRALQYAHTLRSPDGTLLNIVHRDVTPSNVLIDVEGHVKLADFGIAQMSSEQTDAGKRSIKGKFPYLAPEILENNDPSPGSDVYSAGLVLHELLVGRNEFTAKGIPAIVSRVLKHTPTSVDALRDDIPPGLAPIIAKSLEKDPARRYTTAGEFADALSNVRRLSEDEGARELASVATTDFRDPRMAAFLSVPELDALESDWRTPASTIDNLTDPDFGTARPVAVSPVKPAREDQYVDTVASTDYDVAIERDGRDASAPRSGLPAQEPVRRTRPETLDRTVAGSPAALTGGPRLKTSPGITAVSAADTATGRAAEPRGGQRSRWPIVLGGVALAGVGAVAIAALVKAGDRAPRNDEPAYIVMDDRRPGGEPPRPEPIAAPADAATAVAAPPSEPPDAGAAAVAPRRPPPTNTPPETSAERLNKAFAKQKSKIARCFNDHAVDVSGAPELSLRFTVETDGTTSRAELNPAALRGTELGRCIEAIARATQFGRQSKQVTFRVPLKARVR